MNGVDEDDQRFQIDHRFIDEEENYEENCNSVIILLCEKFGK